MKKIHTVFGILAVMAAIAAGTYWFFIRPAGVGSVSAVVEGPVVPIVVGIPGLVRDVYVATGDAVAQGQPLLALDPAGLERQLAEERQYLAKIAAYLPPSMLVLSPSGGAPGSSDKPLAQLRAEEEEAYRYMTAAAQAHAAAGLAFSRLSGQGASGYGKTSPERQAALMARDETAALLRHAKEAFEQASMARAQREARDKAEQRGAVVSAALASRMAEYQAQLSRVRLAEQNLAGAVFRSPVGGVASLVAVLPGETLAVGDTPLILAPEKPGEVWVTAFFDPKEAKGLLPGMVCEILLAGSGARASGVLAHIQPAANTEKPVAARVTLNREALPEAFKPGAGASVTVLPSARPE